MPTSFSSPTTSLSLASFDTVPSLTKQQWRVLFEGMIIQGIKARMNPSQSFLQLQSIQTALTHLTNILIDLTKIMYTQLLGLFGILASTALASSSSSAISSAEASHSAPAANPTITPAIFFAVGDNVVGSGQKYLSHGDLNGAGEPVWTNAHTYTLNLTKGSWEAIGLYLWEPPLSGTPPPATPSGKATAEIVVSPLRSCMGTSPDKAVM